MSSNQNHLDGALSSNQGISKTVRGQPSPMGPWGAPSDQLVNKHTGLLHCVLRRENTPTPGSFTSKTTLFWEGESEVRLLTAKQIGKSHYEIVSAESVVIGILYMSQQSFASISYDFVVNDQLVMRSVFQVQTILSVLGGKSLPRYARVLLFDKIDIIDLTGKTPTEASRSISSVMRPKMKTKHSPHLPPAKHAFTTVVPYLKSCGRLGLNFQGRGRLASNKNVQLTQSDQSNASNVSFQMVAWGSQEYHVDFKAPWTVVQAFAFSLAQLDL